MKTPTTALLAAFSVSLVAAHVSAAPPKAAADSKVPSAVPTAARTPKLKALTKLAVKNAAAVPGETRNLTATLTAPSGTPIAGKSITVLVTGKNGTKVPGGSITVGSAMTGPDGKATLAFKLPELAQGAYALKASFAGDDDTGAASAEGNLGVIKGMTEFELGSLIWGTYKNEPGPPSGSIMITLKRKSDGEPLKKSFYITVNGAPRRQVTPSYGSFVTIPLPSSASTWVVKAEYEGDEANQATSAQRTYQKPN